MADGNLADNMMTVTEVSRILHVHPNTLRRWSGKRHNKIVLYYTAW
jgi:hypothetical protein